MGMGMGIGIRIGGDGFGNRGTRCGRCVMMPSAPNLVGLVVRWLMLMLLLLVPLVFWQKGVKAFKPKTKTGN